MTSTMACQFSCGALWSEIWMSKFLCCCALSLLRLATTKAAAATAPPARPETIYCNGLFYRWKLIIVPSYVVTLPIGQSNSPKWPTSKMFRVQFIFVASHQSAKLWVVFIGFLRHCKIMRRLFENDSKSGNPKSRQMNCVVWLNFWSNYFTLNLDAMRTRLQYYRALHT